MEESSNLQIRLEIVPFGLSQETRLFLMSSAIACKKLSKIDPSYSLARGILYPNITVPISNKLTAVHWDKSRFPHQLYWESRCLGKNICLISFIPLLALCVPKAILNYPLCHEHIFIWSCLCKCIYNADLIYCSLGCHCYGSIVCHWQNHSPVQVVARGQIKYCLICF